MRTRTGLVIVGIGAIVAGFIIAANPHLTAIGTIIEKVVVPVCIVAGLVLVIDGWRRRRRRQ